MGKEQNLKKKNSRNIYSEKQTFLLIVPKHYPLGIKDIQVYCFPNTIHSFITNITLQKSKSDEYTGSGAIIIRIILSIQIHSLLLCTMISAVQTVFLQAKNLEVRRVWC